MGLLFLLVATLLIVPAAAPARPAHADALEAALHDLCRREIVLLGEADHGDGATVAFKVALVRALVARCHFGAVFFEANHYEFIDVDRRLHEGQPAGPERIAAAVGGMWNHDSEFAPLVPFLFAEARAGRLTLAGIDDQVGSAGTLYEPDELPDELASFLPSGRREACAAALRRRTHYDYGPGHAYDDAARAALLACLAEAERAIPASQGLTPDRRAEALEMTASFIRNLRREPSAVSDYIVGRDRSMFLNFQWLAARLPPHHRRIIVWAANSHIARDATASGDYATGPNLGALIHQAYGDRAFALGITAAGGAHYWSRSERSRPLADAAPGSIEARALAGSAAESIYLDRARLAALGAAPASAFQHRPRVIRWDRAFDGLVVLRAERPPRRTD